MSLRRSIIPLLILIVFSSAAQVTNIRKWRKTERDSLEYGLYLYDDKSYHKALPVMESIYNNHPGEEFIKYVYARCALYRSDKHEMAYQFLNEIYQKNQKVEDIHYDLALAAHYNNRFDEAMEHINTHLLNRRLQPGARAEAELLKRYITNARYYVSNPTQARFSNPGSNINSEADETRPVITADESLLAFTYAGPKSVGGRQNSSLQPDRNGDYTEDMYLSYKAGSFTKAFPLDSLNTNATESAVALSNDGSLLFIYKSDFRGDIYQCERVGDHYSQPHKVLGQVNSYYQESGCSLSPDGKTIYFSSDRPGGFGGKDLYKASLSGDGSWQGIENLGDSVNTAYDEDAPFIHPDGVSLYYSSKGRSSMGGYDVFKATMTVADSTFKKVESLGYPINTTDDDLYFVLSASGETGYYSSFRKGGMGRRDIYRIETNFIGSRPAVYVVKGRLMYEGDEVEGHVKVEITSMNNALYRSFDSHLQHGYFIALPAGATYKITYSYKDQPDHLLHVDVPKITGYTEKEFDVEFLEKPSETTLTGVVSNAQPAVSKAEEDAAAAKKAAEEAAFAKIEAEAKARVERLAAEQAAKEKAEAEAKARAERITAEKAAAEAAKKAAAEEAARKQAEARARAEQLAFEQAVIKERAQAEAKARAERAAAERAAALEAKKAAEKEAREKAERLAGERALAKAQAEIDARDRAERLAEERAAARKAAAEAAAKARAEAKATADAQAAKKAETQRLTAKELAAAKAINSAPKPKTELLKRVGASTVATKKTVVTPLAAKTKTTAAKPAVTHTTAPKPAAVAAKTAAPKPAAATKAIAAKTLTLPVSGPATNTFVSTLGRQKDGFMPRTRLHEKAIRYIDKFGDVKVPGLEFKVQITAFKTDRNQDFPQLHKFGKIERVKLGDGFTRLYIGGSFKTLKAAFALTKKVVQAGQTDAFVSAFYKGKRYPYEDLQKMGIFK